jgi:N-methylhydantoinase A
MVQLVREMTIGQGYDPRDFTLVAFGGNGPQYAAEVATELDIAEVVVPTNASVFSALGCLYADIRHEYVRTIYAPAEPVTEKLLGTVAEAFTMMRARAHDDLALDGISEEPTFVHEFDLRYVGEAYEIKISQRLPGTPDAATLVEAIGDFHDEHARLYGFRREDPVELLNARVVAIVPVTKPSWAEGTSERGRHPVKERRTVFQDGAPQEVDIFERVALTTEMHVTGPCVIEEAQDTTFLPPGWTAAVDHLGNLRLVRALEPAADRTRPPA